MKMSMIIKKEYDADFSITATNLNRLSKIIRENQDLVANICDEISGRIERPLILDHSRRTGVEAFCIFVSEYRQRRRQCGITSPTQTNTSSSPGATSATFASSRRPSSSHGSAAPASPSPPSTSP